MGEAKRRGTKDQRALESVERAKLEAIRREEVEQAAREAAKRKRAEELAAMPPAQRHAAVKRDVQRQRQASHARIMLPLLLAALGAGSRTRR